MALYVNNFNVTYSDSLGVKHIIKKIKKFIDNKNIITDIYCIRVYNSIMCRYFCIGFIYFMLKDESLKVFDKRFYQFIFLNEYEKTDQTIRTKNFKIKKTYCIICDKFRNFKNSKISCISEKALVLSIGSSNCGNEDESIEILKILG